jgi:hypothetical protein
MTRFVSIVFSSLLIACGPPPGNGGGAGADSGPQADAGAVADTGGGGTTTPTICDLHASNTFAQCVGCHGNAGGIGIDVTSPQTLYDSFVGVSGNSVEALVVGGNADASWLWVRMNEMQGEDSMPPAGKLQGNVRNPVRDWINGNALDDCL